jgi:hypothetical protein
VATRAHTVPRFRLAGFAAKIAGLYRVARRFRRRYDEGAGLGRYGPVLSALEDYRMEKEADPVEAVLGFTRDLERVYQREVLSAASKFLWLVWGQDIIIYDSQALATIRREFAKVEPKGLPWVLRSLEKVL